jgi:hypothetical protein
MPQQDAMPDAPTIEAPPHLQPVPGFVPPAPMVASGPRQQPSNLSTGTGTGVLLATAGAGAGFALGGGWGALAGLFLVGATRNAARAASGNRAPEPGGGYSEATKSGTMAIFGFGLGGYFAYLAAQQRRGRD